MRLQSLKLAGFKSFVDPVTFRFPDALTAIVGPNGCGKSNVVDAIRWVMGESSARQLRGEAMSDVIFAGTGQRKPVGLASVELVFENTLGKLGGAYRDYAELALRRQVNRDGRSEYFLNGQRCRRRDVTDIFLGTGLGVQSYAVIQQGMIHRLVEAKPDDLRVLIEEAAGVSRYQSRRRDTEQHLEHTGLNLVRLQDLAEELASQMHSLSRQSQAAERYHRLKNEQQQLQVEIWSLRAQQLQQQQHQDTVQLEHWGEQFRQLKTQQQQIEQHEQQLTAELAALLVQAEPEQQHWQKAEQQSAHCQMRSQQLEQQQQQLIQQQQTQQQQQAALAEQLQRDQAQCIQLAQHCQQTEQALQCLPDARQLSDAVQAVEQTWRAWHAEDAQNQQQLAQLQQQRQHAQQQQAALNKQQQRAQQQIWQLEQHGQQLAVHASSAQWRQLEQQFAQAQVQAQQLAQQQQQLDQHVISLHHKIDMAQQQQQLLQQQLAADQAEQAALQQMQAALCISPAVIDHMTPAVPVLRLVQQLELTEQGQQHAVILEAMLTHWLLAQAEGQPTQPLEAGQAYYRRAVRSALTTLEHPQVKPIQHWLIAPQLSLWAGVGIVTDHATALQLRDRLSAGQSLLTLTGEWVGLDWQLSLQPATAERSAAVHGALTCQLRLEQLQQQIIMQQQQLAEQQQQQAEQQRQLTAQQQQQQRIAEQQQQQQHSQRQLELEQASLSSRLHSQAQQKIQLEQQLSSVLQAQADDQTELNDLFIKLTQLETQLQSIQQTTHALQQQREPLARQRQQQLAEQQLAEQQRLRIAAEQQTQHMRQTLLLEQVSRQEQQYTQHARLIVETLTTLQPLAEQLAEAMLQQEQASIQATAARQTWQQRQTRLTAIQAAQQQATQQRHQQQQAEQVLRDQMEHTRLIWQGRQAEIDHLAQQFRQLNRVPLPDLHEDGGAREQHLITVTTQLARLGELNLAAPAALTGIAARHAELTHQIEDLQQTVQQLEQAMQQIDRETRRLFMATFDRINLELHSLFPKIFGGGEAYLTLEADWQSGVRLMAQPPGKKNSNISVLSGGEKALAALALVFAIFKLNPAPFCVLDEVDAPLDDANVARFCHLVQGLSTQVQFIFISHNKLAMSMASQLLGVTMPEAGISRLVAVNLEQAAAFAPLQE